MLALTAPPCAASVGWSNDTSQPNNLARATVQYVGWYSARACRSTCNGEDCLRTVAYKCGIFGCISSCAFAFTDFAERSISDSTSEYTSASVNTYKHPMYTS